MRNHLNASVVLCGTPFPRWYIIPTESSASGSPAAAARWQTGAAELQLPARVEDEQSRIASASPIVSRGLMCALRRGGVGFVGVGVTGAGATGAGATGAGAAGSGAGAGAAATVVVSGAGCGGLAVSAIATGAGVAAVSWATTAGTGSDFGRKARTTKTTPTTSMSVAAPI